MFQFKFFLAHVLRSKMVRSEFVGLRWKVLLKSRTEILERGILRIDIILHYRKALNRLLPARFPNPDFFLRFLHEAQFGRIEQPLVFEYRFKCGQLYILCFGLGLYLKLVEHFQAFRRLLFSHILLLQIPPHFRLIFS